MTFNILMISLYSTDHNKPPTQATTELGEATDQTTLQASATKEIPSKHVIYMAKILLTPSLPMIRNKFFSKENHDAFRVPFSTSVSPM